VIVVLVSQGAEDIRRELAAFDYETRTRGKRFVASANPACPGRSGSSPIVDVNGGLQGLLSIDDVLGWMRDQIQAVTKLLERQGELALLHMLIR
jgi:hypothetical protein